MRISHDGTFRPIAIALALALAAPAAALAQDPPPPQNTPQTPPPAAQQRAGSSLPVGIEAFAGAAFGWPAASDSFEASSLDSTQTQFGGGARVTSIWRDLFAEVAVSRWSDTGERVFIDSTGERFPLGIPLSVKATYVDVSVGWKTPVVTSTGRVSMLPYVGGGTGVTMYEESSPFAEPGENVDTRTASYTVFAGVEVPILRWLAVGVDGRYRYVPDILGDEGVSGVLEDDSLGGFQVALALRVGFGGDRPPVPPAKPTEEEAGTARRPFVGPPTRQPAAENEATILERAPVYLLPDPKRVPLRVLDPGTTVRVLEEAGEWIRIEFPDPQFGPRVGYVLRKFVRMPGLP